jgi:hypothetical protein
METGFQVLTWLYTELRDKMPTYAQIATTTVATSNTTNSITFSSLGSYTDLFIIASTNGSRSTFGGDFHVRFNGDSGTNYNNGFIRSQSTTTNTSSYGSVSEMNMGGNMGGTGTSNFSLYYIFIPNYRNTSIDKTIHGFDAGAGTEFTSQEYSIGRWDNTAAITSITFLNEAGVRFFQAGTTISLYGILAA